MPAISTGLAIGLGALSAGTAVAGSALQSRAAGKTANAQVGAANHAADLQKQSEDASLAETKRQFDQNQADLAPWLSGGKAALSELLTRTLNGGDLSKPWNEKFTAPTAAEASADPAYQFRVDQGTKAIEASAAAKGNLFSGGVAKDLQTFGQGEASAEYDKTYSRKFDEYIQRYNEFMAGNADAFNRLAAISGTGQTTASQLAKLGSDEASDVSGILTGSASRQGQEITNAGAARASGYVGSGNAWAGAFGNAGGIGQDVLLMSMLRKKAPAGAAVV